LSDPLIYVRAVHFAATILAAGVALFVVLVAEPAFRKAGDVTQAPTAIRRRLNWIALSSLALAVISGAAWFDLTAAAMSGQSVADVFCRGVWWTVLSRTTFGNDWLIRFTLVCLLAGLFDPSLAEQRIKSRGLKAALALSAAALAGTLAWSGHAAGGLGAEAIIHPAADVLHLVAAAAWVGALIPLALLLGAVAREPAALPIAQSAVLRFSTLGIASVATLLVTGIVNTWYLAGSIPALTQTDYGKLLLAKLALFLGMVAIAAVNRQWLTPRIVAGAGAAVTGNALRQLRRNAAIDALAGAAVIGIVAVLGTLPPASHAEHHATYGALPPDAAFVHIHSEQGMADVMILPGRVGAARATIHLWNEDLEALDVKGVTLTLTPPAAGDKLVTRIAAQDPDAAWHVDGLELPQPGTWTASVDAVLGTGKHLLLEAPIVIER
jgi:copper resistance protein D